LANEDKTDEELEGTEDESSEEPEAAKATDEETAEGADEGSDDGSDDDESDDGSDDDGSDDDESDDDESDDDESDDDEPEAKAGSKSGKSSKRRKKKTGRKKRKPKTTAGQRLAAAKAAKAARKAAQRGKDAEKVEDKAAEQAQAASRWLEQNRQKLLMAVAAIVLIFAGVFAFNRFAKAGDAEAATALWEAMEIANARVVDPEEEDVDDVDEDDEEVTFESESARAEAAIEAFDEVVANHAGTQAAAFARIGLANASRVLGDNSEARAAYEAALAESDAPEVALRALEGIGFTYEVDEDWDEAEARFDEMGDIDRPGARILADYHLARIALAQDETERAKEKLQALLESLDEDDAPQMEYVRDQAEMRLREIDPSLVQSSAPSMMPGMGGPGGPGGAGGAFGGAGGEGMTPEMQRMLEELMRKQQQGQ